MRGKIIVIFALVGVLTIGVWIYLHYQSQTIQTDKTTQIGKPENVPEVPGSKLKYKVVGAKSVVFLVEVKYENSYYNYNYNVDMGNKTEGLLPLEPGPERENIRVYIIAISETGRKSEPLIIENKDWWDKVKSFVREYAMEHTFKIQ